MAKAGRRSTQQGGGRAAHFRGRPVEAGVLKQGVQTYLRQVGAEILELTGRYGVSGVEEMERKYQTGELEEADSWRDLQKLDRLEYERDRLARLIGETE